MTEPVPSAGQPAAWRPHPVARLVTHRVAREAYWAAADQAVISLANMAASVFVARYVTPAEFGMYGVGFIAVRLVRALPGALIIQPMHAYGAIMPEEEFRRYLSTVALLQLVLAGLSGLGAALAGWVLTRLRHDVAGPTLVAPW